jgi:hypothetical protein
VIQVGRLYRIECWLQVAAAETNSFFGKGVNKRFRQKGFQALIAFIADITGNERARRVTGVLGTFS